MPGGVWLAKVYDQQARGVRSDDIEDFDECVGVLAIAATESATLFAAKLSGGIGIFPLGVGRVCEYREFVLRGNEPDFIGRACAMLDELLENRRLAGKFFA